MSVHTQPIHPVPEETARVARLAFPKGNRHLTLRDEIGTIYTDQDFADLFSTYGQSAVPPWCKFSQTSAGDSHSTSAPSSRKLRHLILSKLRQVILTQLRHPCLHCTGSFSEGVGHGQTKATRRITANGKISRNLALARHGL